MTPDERRDANKVGLDLPSDPHENENENDEAQDTSQAEENRSADKSVELASLQEELAQQVRGRATKVNALSGPFCTFTRCHPRTTNDVALCPPLAETKDAGCRPDLAAVA